MLSALVTGARGALGRYVARRFAHSGYMVRGLGHGTWSASEASDWRLSFWHSCDVTLEALATHAAEPDVIVHCAGSASVAFSATHPYEDYLRTVASTAAVLEYMRLYARDCVLVFPSSAAVYGVARTLPIAESAPQRPVSPYGVHKLMAEELCRSYASQFGLSIVIIRFFSVYGDGFQKQLLWDACNKARSGQISFDGSGQEIRDWLHAEDAAELMRLAVTNASPAVPTVNGGTGVATTVQAVVTEVFAKLCPGRTPSFTGAARRGDPPGYLADTTHSRSFSWAPKIEWRDGVSRYVDWFRATYR